MKIRYETTIEDLVAFNHYHIEHSPTLRRERVRFMLMVGLAGMAPPVALDLVLTRSISLSSVTFGIVVAGVVLLLFPWVNRRGIDRRVRRMCGEGANKGMIGLHELELIGDELVERTQIGESRVRLQMVERVATDEDYTFIYVGAIQAYIIPHDGVYEGDPEAFVEAIEQRMALEPATESRFFRK